MHRDLSERPEFKVLESLMLETGTYGPMFNRVYSNTMQNRDVVDEFLEATNDGREINSINMAGLSGRIVRPSSLPQSEIHIDGGFNERRMVFMIALEHKSYSSRNPKVTIISGYSDRVDVTYKGTVAPDLRMYINAVTQVNVLGQPRPVDISHVISANSYDSFDMEGHRQDHYGETSLQLLRPMDVIRNMEHIHGDSYDNIDTNNVVMQSRNLTSRRTNGLSSRYLSSIVNSVLSAETDDLFETGMRQSRYALARASSGVKEGSLIQDAVTRELKEVSTFLTDGYVTYSDLNRIVPTLDAKTDIMFMKDNPDLQMRQSRNHDTESWDGGNQATVAATIISQSLGAILSSCLLAYIEVEFTNETITGDTKVKIKNLASFGDFIDPATQAKHLEFVIVNELMPILTFNGEYDISVRVEFDIQLDALISISWDGESWVDYTTPNFCDGLLSPVITTNNRLLTDMSRQTGALIDSILNRNH